MVILVLGLVILVLALVGVEVLPCLTLMSCSKVWLLELLVAIVIEQELTVQLPKKRNKVKKKWFFFIPSHFL